MLAYERSCSSSYTLALYDYSQRIEYLKTFKAAFTRVPGKDRPGAWRPENASSEQLLCSFVHTMQANESWAFFRADARPEGDPTDITYIRNASGASSAYSAQRYCECGLSEGFYLRDLCTCAWLCSLPANSGCAALPKRPLKPPPAKFT